MKLKSSLERPNAGEEVTMSTMGNAHGLVIGIANYQHISPLPATVLKDATDIHQLLVDPNLCAYPVANVQLLLDEKATLEGLRQGLAHLARRCDQDSTIFIYLSSHGGRMESGPHAGEYILSVDSVYTSGESLAATAISGAEFTAALRAIPGRKMVIVFDCCHSGGIGQPKVSGLPEIKSIPESYYEALKSGRGRVILASSRSDEYSYVLGGASNSLFTHHLLGALRGGAPGPGGVIRIFDLFSYVQPRVTKDHAQQHPIFKAEVEENFPIAFYLGGKAATATPTSAPGDGFKYDVFVSYRQEEPEKSWVRKTLVSQIEAQGLHVCIDYRDFRLGAPLVLEMARAVEESRYTLAVLTESYLTSNFAQLESVLAEHLGLERSERRLLAVMRQSCKPRLGMRARLWLDMTDDDAFAVDLQRLVYELRQPALG
jgi:Caspase domain/TIR domain